MQSKHGICQSNSQGPEVPAQGVTIGSHIQKSEKMKGVCRTHNNAMKSTTNPHKAVYDSTYAKHLEVPVCDNDQNIIAHNTIFHFYGCSPTNDNYSILLECKASGQKMVWQLARLLFECRGIGMEATTHGGCNDNRPAGEAKPQA